MSARQSEPPEVDLARIRRFAQARTPTSLADQVRLEVEVDGGKVTMVECRPPWKDFGPAWSRRLIAQLRHDAKRATWTLYWQRATGRWQRYELATSPNVDRLLQALDADRDGTFCG